MNNMNISSIESSKHYLTNEQFGNCRSVWIFTKLNELGEGTYGTVFKGMDTTNHEIFALKKIRMDVDPEGFPITAIREIKILEELKHPNIVSLKEVVVGKKNDSIYLVLEYCETDLVKLCNKANSLNVTLELAYIKSLVLQLITGVDHLHRNYIIHRDLKLSNLLLNKNGQLKIADFGLARHFSSDNDKYTPKLVTLWYRAPEILLQSKNYSWSSDMWAVGCIFGEILSRGKPLLPGNNEVNQFDLICNLIGKPNSLIWPDFFQLDTSHKLFERTSNTFNFLNERFKDTSKAAQSLLNSLLTWDPTKRITASEAMLHDFFSEPPYPSMSKNSTYLNL